MKERFKIRKKTQIAIYGLGSTRLAIALANYYSSHLKKKVALGEVGEGNLSDMSEENVSSRLTVSEDKSLVGFRRMKADYYPYINKESVTVLESEPYEVIIWDYKDISHDYMESFKRCDRRLFLCNIAIYNRRTFCRIKNLFEDDMVNVEVYCYLLNKKDKKWYRNAICKSKVCSDVRELRLAEDPDKLSHSDILFLDNLAAANF